MPLLHMLVVLTIVVPDTVGLWVVWLRPKTSLGFMAM